jgi:AcrR family transcriptional regulator
MARRTTKVASRSPGRPKNLELPARRRAEILDVATRMFAESGYASTDIQELADRLGVGKGTIYRYFPRKEELFLAAVDHGMRRLKEHVDQAADRADTGLGRVRAGIKAYLAFFAQHPEVVELFIQERAHFRSRQTPTYFIHRNANVGPWQDLFRQLIRERVIRKVPVRQITDVLSDLLYGTMFTNFFAGHRQSPDRQCTAILDIVLHGLLVKPESTET